MSDTLRDDFAITTLIHNWAVWRASAAPHPVGFFNRPFGLLFYRFGADWLAGQVVTPKMLLAPVQESAPCERRQVDGSGSEKGSRTCRHR